MGWTAFVDRSGRAWSINQEGLFLLVQAVTRARLIRQRTRMIEINNGMFYPTSYQVETNWAGLRAAVEVETNIFYRDAAVRLADDPMAMWSNLAGMLSSARDDAQYCERLKHRASNDTFNNIDAAGWETQIARFTWLRDTSATVLVVTSGIMTGGAAPALLTLAAGSTLRGIATYQDNGRVGAAVVNGVGTMIVGAIGLGTTAVSGVAQSFEASRRAIALISISGSAVQAGVQTGATVFQGYLEGRSTQAIAAQATTAAFYSMAGAAAGPLAERFGANFGSVTEKMMMAARITVSSSLDTQGNLAGGSMGTGSAPGRVTAQDYLGLPTANTGLPGVRNPRPTEQLRPQLLALARPLTRGNIDFAGIPAQSGLDSEYLQAHVIRRL